MQQHHFSRLESNTNQNSTSDWVAAFQPLRLLLSATWEQFSGSSERFGFCFSCLSAKTSTGAVECFPSAGEAALPTSLAPNQTCRAAPKRSLSSNPWPERAAAVAGRPHTVPQTCLWDTVAWRGRFSCSQKPGDVVMQRESDVYTLYHEGFFWRCSFGGQANGENLLWKLLFSKSDKHKEVL